MANQNYAAIANTHDRNQAKIDDFNKYIQKKSNYVNQRAGIQAQYTTAVNNLDNLNNALVNAVNSGNAGQINQAQQNLNAFTLAHAPLFAQYDALTRKIDNNHAKMITSMS